MITVLAKSTSFSQSAEKTSCQLSRKPALPGTKNRCPCKSMSMIKPISRRLDRDHEKRANEASWSSPSLILSSISFSSIISSHFVLKKSSHFCNHYFSVSFSSEIVILRLPCCSTYYTLVQRCNGSYGTTAGLGYLEVNVIWPCKSPHWAVVYSVRTVDPHRGVAQIPCWL